MENKQQAYCSWCFEKIIPEMVKSSKLTRILYKCPNCSNKLVKCRACSNYARWGLHIQKDKDGKERREKRHDQFCLEHRHEMADFSKAKIQLKEPSDYKQIYEYNAPNLARAGNTLLVLGAGAAVSGPLFYIAEPAIGGALGSMTGLYGAAATAHGLGLLGFGSIAAGGFGMAGGMSVVTAVGTALGGAVGAYIGNAYLRNIYNFEVKKIRPGKGPAVITINGFLSEKDLKNQKGYQDWEKVVNKRFPGKAWYHVYWESKTLYDLGILIGMTGASSTFSAAITKAASHASKQGIKKMGPSATALTVIQLSRNPWHVSLVKAEKAGRVLSDILKRTDKKYTILAHSLGCRVAYCTLETLSLSGASVIEDVHLTGGAVDNNRDNWKTAKQAVAHKIHNYYSNNDKVLRRLYKVGTFFQSSPIGSNKIDYTRGIRNHNVSDVVNGHMSFKPNAHKFVKRK